MLFLLRHCLSSTTDNDTPSIRPTRWGWADAYIVTGGASGIGRELCLSAARKGATVIIADIDVQSAETVCDEIAKLGHVCRVRKVDVSSRSDVEALINQTRSEFGRIDVLVNNAGVGLDGELKDVTYDQFKRVIDVNLWGVVNGTYAVYSVMIGQGFGQIVNVASLAGLLPGGLMTSYVASKQAVVGFSLGLRAEAHQYGIKVNALCPGFIETPLHDVTEKASSYLQEGRNQRDKRLFPTADRCVKTMMKGIERNDLSPIRRTPDYAVVVQFLGGVPEVPPHPRRCNHDPSTCKVFEVCTSTLRVS